MPCWMEHFQREAVEQLFRGGIVRQPQVLEQREPTKTNREAPLSEQGSIWRSLFGGGLRDRLSAPENDWRAGDWYPSGTTKEKLPPKMDPGCEWIVGGGWCEGCVDKGVGFTAWKNKRCARRRGEGR